MDTELLVVRDIDKDRDKLERAAELIRSGALVAIPTETVYGLGANAFDEDAVRKIFQVKGRPQDNPLIIHIHNASQLDTYCHDVPDEALMLAEHFWPGPLTMVLKRRSNIPDVVSAGLDTVAIRCPDHPATLEIIRLSGVPIAAPSANISGSPSPTEAGHVMADISGKIQAVVDGGGCCVGLESTIIDLSSEPFHILRPGGITPGQIQAIVGPVVYDSALFSVLNEDDRPKAPGMKYRHYAPKARVIILKGDISAVSEYVSNKAGENVAVLCFEGEEKHFNVTNVLAYGGEHDYVSQAKNLFSSLRRLDKEPVETIYARCPEEKELGLAVANRLLKAAGYETIEVGK